MKFTLLSACLIAVLSCVVGVIGFWIRSPGADNGSSDDSLLWLRQEFSLSAEQLHRIETLHSSYQVVCEEHCRIIREARSEVRRLKAASGSGADLRQAEDHAQEVDAQCRKSLEAHLREVATIIGGDEGHRYLALVLPRVTHFDHQGAPSLDVANTSASHVH